MAELSAAGSTWWKHLIYGGQHRRLRQPSDGQAVASAERMVHHYAAIIVAGLFLLAVVIQLIVQR
jgi:NADH-quinone oxidoreductase subunit L